MIRRLLSRFKKCAHPDRRGVATYYDRDHRLYLRLTECLGCGAVLIEES